MQFIVKQLLQWGLGAYSLPQTVNVKLVSNKAYGYQVYVSTSQSISDSTSEQKSELADPLMLDANILFVGYRYAISFMFCACAALSRWVQARKRSKKSGDSSLIA
eukprot:GHVR01113347.1.p1 GENE.GHVR01113347.1~~GHVR01113347.1.p1  ORF type:complete len:105 (-),score=0.57 GHVR01113347.1:207-521(-)